MKIEFSNKLAEIFGAILPNSVSDFNTEWERHTIVGIVNHNAVVVEWQDCAMWVNVECYDDDIRCTLMCRLRQALRDYGYNYTYDDMGDDGKSLASLEFHESER